MASTSAKDLVKTSVSRTIERVAEIYPERVGDLLKKAVGAPAETELVTKVDANGVTFYSLTWNDVPKTRAPRKPKAE